MADEGNVQDGAGPEVAVVIPCYRYAHLLPEAVQSVAAQTHANLQIVIVDDGSPDETAAVARALIDQFPARRIKLVQQRNQGLAAARNAGVRATQSPLVLPLDADDRLAPEAVARLARALTEQGADVATPLGRTFGTEDRALVTLPVTRLRLLAGNCLVYASLFKRSLFDRAGGYARNCVGYEDWNLWLTGLEAGARFVHVPEELFFYRRHGPTMLAGSDAQAMALRAAIVCNHPGLYSAWRVGLARRFLRESPQAGLIARLGMLVTLLVDRRLRLFCRQARRATNMLPT